MRIQYCSDLHLEFDVNKKWLQQNPLQPTGDILLIAGDVYYLNRTYRKLDFIKWAADNFQMTYILPGNHEYYGGFDVSTALHPLHEKILDNVMLANNTAIELEGIHFIFSTLWSKITKNFAEITRGMVDFRRINFKEEPFTTDHFNELHDYAFDFLDKAIQKEGKKVVVTHHLPSPLCNAPEFKNSPINVYKPPN